MAPDNCTNPAPGWFQMLAAYWYARWAAAMAQLRQVNLYATCRRKKVKRHQNRRMNQ